MVFNGQCTDQLKIRSVGRSSLDGWQVGVRSDLMKVLAFFRSTFAVVPTVGTLVVEEKQRSSAVSNETGLAGSAGTHPLAYHNQEPDL